MQRNGDTKTYKTLTAINITTDRDMMQYDYVDLGLYHSAEQRENIVVFFVGHVLSSHVQSSARSNAAFGCKYTLMQTCMPQTQRKHQDA